MGNHKGVLLEVREALKLSTGVARSYADKLYRENELEHMFREYYQALTKLDALIEAVPSEIRFQRCDYDVHDLPILRIAAKLLHEATTEKEERCKDTKEMF